MNNFEVSRPPPSSVSNANASTSSPDSAQPKQEGLLKGRQVSTTSDNLKEIQPKAKLFTAYTEFDQIAKEIRSLKNKLENASEGNPELQKIETIAARIDTHIQQLKPHLPETTPAQNEEHFAFQEAVGELIHEEEKLKQELINQKEILKQELAQKLESAQTAPSTHSVKSTPIQTPKQSRVSGTAEKVFKQISLFVQATVFRPFIWVAKKISDRQELAKIEITAKNVLTKLHASSPLLEKEMDSMMKELPAGQPIPSSQEKIELVSFLKKEAEIDEKLKNIKTTSNLDEIRKDIEELRSMPTPPAFHDLLQFKLYKIDVNFTPQVQQKLKYTLSAMPGTEAEKSHKVKEILFENSFEVKSAFESLQTLMGKEFPIDTRIKEALLHTLQKDPSLVGRFQETLKAGLENQQALLSKIRASKPIDEEDLGNEKVLSLLPDLFVDFIGQASEEHHTAIKDFEKIWSVKSGVMANTQHIKDIVLLGNLSEKEALALGSDGPLSRYLGTRESYKTKEKMTGLDDVQKGLAQADYIETQYQNIWVKSDWKPKSTDQGLIVEWQGGYALSSNRKPSNQTFSIDFTPFGKLNPEEEKQLYTCFCIFMNNPEEVRQAFEKGDPKLLPIEMASLMPSTEAPMWKLLTTTVKNSPPLYLTLVDLTHKFNIDSKVALLHSFMELGIK